MEVDLEALKQLNDEEPISQLPRTIADGMGDLLQWVCRTKNFLYHPYHSSSNPPR
jgi:hypothetical protein